MNQSQSCPSCLLKVKPVFYISTNGIFPVERAVRPVPTVTLSQDNPCPWILSLRERYPLRSQAYGKDVKTVTCAEQVHLTLHLTRPPISRTHGRGGHRWTFYLCTRTCRRVTA